MSWERDLQQHEIILQNPASRTGRRRHPPLQREKLPPARRMSPDYSWDSIKILCFISWEGSNKIRPVLDLHSKENCRCRSISRPGTVI